MKHPNLGEIDSLSERFLTELSLRSELGPSRVSKTDRVEVVFPAKDPEVGNIHVWLDGDEVTVGIGESFHTHFESYLDSSVSKEEGEFEAIRSALDFISDFMKGRLILDVKYRGDRPTGATVRAPGEKRKASATVGIGLKHITSRIRNRRTGTRRYSWNGPLKREG
jgi:hypothetical protein